MGTPNFAVMPLQAIMKEGHQLVSVVTVPDKPAGRGRQLQASAVKQFAENNQLPLLQPEKLKDENFISQLNILAPDVIVVVAFRMLPREVWQIPRLGTFNLHASLLPQYRGAAPINWAVINGEKESGVTTFLIDDKIDTGAILLQEKVELAPDETAGTLHDKLMNIGSYLVVETLNRLAIGNITPQVQPESGDLKPAPKIFRDTCIINWQKPGLEIEQHIRGLSPFPGAFGTWRLHHDSAEVKILMAKFHPERTVNYQSGTIWVDKRQLFVALTDGILEIKMLQPQGKKALSASEFINGLRQIKGDWRFL